MNVADYHTMSVYDSATGGHFCYEFFIKDDIGSGGVDGPECGEQSKPEEGGRSDEAGAPLWEERPSLSHSVEEAEW